MLPAGVSYGGVRHAVPVCVAHPAHPPGAGEELRRVALPVRRPTACTFGGPQLEHLYVTTRVETGACL